MGRGVEKEKEILMLIGDEKGIMYLFFYYFVTSILYYSIYELFMNFILFYFINFILAEKQNQVVVGIVQVWNVESLYGLVF